MLLTSTDSIIKVWNAKVNITTSMSANLNGVLTTCQTGVFIRESEKHQETVSAIEWLPDSSGLLSGGMDRKIHHWVGSIALC